MGQNEDETRSRATYSRCEIASPINDKTPHAPILTRKEESA